MATDEVGGPPLKLLREPGQPRVVDSHELGTLAASDAGQRPRDPKSYGPCRSASSRSPVGVDEPLDRAATAGHRRSLTSTCLPAVAGERLAGVIDRGSVLDFRSRLRVESKLVDRFYERDEVGACRSAQNLELRVGSSHGQV